MRTSASQATDRVQSANPITLVVSGAMTWLLFSIALVVTVPGVAEYLSYVATAITNAIGWVLS